MQIPTMRNRMHYHSAALLLFFLFGSSLNALAQSVTWYQDNDGDGFGNPLVSQVSTIQPAGYADNDLDCNDHMVNNLVWTQVGATLSHLTSLVFDASNTPYVSFSDATQGNKASVKKFDGTNWVYVGSAGFSASAVAEPDMAIDATGALYVVYADASNSNTVTVKKYNGSSWTTLGATGISATGAANNSPVITIDNTNTPYIFFNESALGFGSVMKYNGTAWSYVGTQGFTIAPIIYPGIDVSTNGDVYVSWGNAGTSANKHTISRFNGTSWTQYYSSSTFIDGYNVMDVFQNDVYTIINGATGLEGAFVSKNSGSGWSQLSPSPGGYPSYNLNVRVSNSNKVYASLKNV